MIKYNNHQVEEDLNFTTVTNGKAGYDKISK